MLSLFPRGPQPGRGAEVNKVHREVKHSRGAQHREWGSESDLEAHRRTPRRGPGHRAGKGEYELPDGLI